MLRKMIVCLLSLTLCSSIMFVSAKAMYVPSIDPIIYVGNGYIQEIETNNSTTREWIVYDSGIYHQLFIDYAKQVMIMDDEIIEYAKEEILMPATRTTIDYSSATKISSKIPWKGSVTLLAAGIGALVGGGQGASWAAFIASVITADAENIWVTFTQYDSIENYWSSYYGIYYKKSINRDIIFYETSVALSNKLYGPVQGSWFDPIRPL